MVSRRPSPLPPLYSPAVLLFSIPHQLPLHYLLFIHLSLLSSTHFLKVLHLLPLTFSFFLPSYTFFPSSLLSIFISPALLYQQASSLHSFHHLRLFFLSSFHFTPIFSPVPVLPYSVYHFHPCLLFFSSPPLPLSCISKCLSSPYFTYSLSSLCISLFHFVSTPFPALYFPFIPIPIYYHFLLSFFPYLSRIFYLLKTLFLSLYLSTLLCPFLRVFFLLFLCTFTLSLHSCTSPTSPILLVPHRKIPSFHLSQSSHSFYFLLFSPSLSISSFLSPSFPSFIYRHLSSYTSITVYSSSFLLSFLFLSIYRQGLSPFLSIQSWVLLLFLPLAQSSLFLPSTRSLLPSPLLPPRPLPRSLQSNHRVMTPSS